MKILILIPAIVYLALLIINLDIFSATTQINFFWLTRFEIPVVIFISLFFILYIVLIWVIFNFWGAFSNLRNKKLEKEVYELKSKLLSGQWELIEKIEQKFENILESHKEESDKKLELYKKENDKIVSNMNYNIKNLEEKIVKLSK